MTGPSLLVAPREVARRRSRRPLPGVAPIRRRCRRRSLAVGSLACALALAACGRGEPDASSAQTVRAAEADAEAGEGLDRGAAATAMAAAEGEAGSERARILGPFLERYWRLPVPPQGEPPAGWSALETSLRPEDCGACHPKQWSEWKGTLHAEAFSPGLAGQLEEGALSRPEPLRHCQTCHAPLAEQQPVRADGSANPAFDPELRQRGIVCASCHVRSHRRFGPPRREGLPPLPEDPPHGGFTERDEHTEARFCASCHQFFDDAGVSGKPLENTFVEWRESPHAERGETCQSCHMPERKHLWRGIHDPEMVREAVDVELALLPEGAEAPGPGREAAPLRAALVLRSRGVGHRFPTYVTPRVLLEVWQEEPGGRPLEGTRMRAIIGRSIDFRSSPWRERFDTRVEPGESVKLAYAKPRAEGAAVLVGRVTVEPDHHYRGVFRELLGSLEAAEAREAIREAYERTTRSSYVLTELRRPLPERPAP